MGILKELHKGGRTVILITHDNEIAAQAERVIKIKDGCIEADSPGQSIKTASVAEIGERSGTESETAEQGQERQNETESGTAEQN